MAFQEKRLTSQGGKGSKRGTAISSILRQSGGPKVKKTIASKQKGR